MNSKVHLALLATEILLLVTLFSGCGHSSKVPQPSDLPNILMIVSDDQGYNDLDWVQNGEAITPSLDRLAREGVSLTNFYVTWPACTPSRASLLSGRYPQRNGVYDMIRNEAPDYGYEYKPSQYQVTFERIGGMDTREKLLPAYLKDAGYVSGIFGKWDLGVHQRFLPLSKGFDHFYGFVNTGIDYYTHERYGVPSMYRDNQPTEEDKGIYCTFLFKREAVKFLEENHKNPFFLYLPFNAPHSASNLDPRIRGVAQAPEQYKQLYPQFEDGFVERENHNYQYRESKEGPVINQYPSKSKRRLEYLASITAMDEAIGEILDLLDQYKIAENTLVIFLSDNGGSGGSTDNYPLRGHKGLLFEGGVRVPCIVKFPGKIPAGSVSNEFLTSLEILPTILNLAGLSLPEEIILDGFDMMPVLRGETGSGRNEMFWQRQDHQAARVGNWKWVESTGGSGLFNLEEDIRESNDLSESRPDKLLEMKQQFAQWRSEMDAAEPRGPFRDF